MLRWALIFLVIGLIAGLLGFTSVAGASIAIAKTLFFIFMVIFLVLLVLAFEKSGGPTSVAPESDALHADYDLFVDIKDFEVRYAVKDGVPEALVTLTVRLATSKGRNVAGTTTVTQRTPASANSVTAATQALGQALGAACAGIVTWAATFPAPPAATVVR